MAGLTPASLLDLTFLRDARLAPDGKTVAYVISRTAEREELEVWLAPINDSSKARRISVEGQASAPRWSPDGTTLAIVVGGRLRAVTVSDLSISAPLTPPHLSVQGAAAWSPDGMRLAVSLMEYPQQSGVRRIANAHFRADGIGFVDGLSQHIYECIVATGDMHCLTSAAPGLCWQPDWSVCGDKILFFATREPIPNASYSPHLMVVDVAAGSLTEILGDGWFITAARWLSDGVRIAVAAARYSALTMPNPLLWVIDSQTGDVDCRTPDLDGIVGARIHHDTPSRELMAGGQIIITGDDEAVISVQHRGQTQVRRIALTGPVSHHAVLDGARTCCALDAIPQANLLLFAQSEMTRPAELWQSCLDGSSAGRLVQTNDVTLAAWPRVVTRRFTFISADGLEVEAWFMSAADKSGPLPTVLFIHGGPFGAVGEAFCFDFHLLAAHGYGVLFANFRGSAGYGDVFTRAIMGDWGARGYADHLGAVDAAVARGLADPQRLAVWGFSHGGFATCWIVGHTSIFKAAVAEGSITNFATLYYLTDAPDTFRHDLGGRPHEIPDAYRARSPITYAHRCITPTMLIHGEDDLRAPMAESEQFFRALHDVGCPTALVRLPGAAHLGGAVGSLAARVGQNQALLEWITRFV